MTMRKAPPFKQRMEAATAHGKAIGARRVKINPDGGVEFDLAPDAPDPGAAANDFDLKPVLPARREHR
jgi:hypothetical protein